MLSCRDGGSRALPSWAAWRLHGARRTAAAPAPSVEHESPAFGYRDVLRFGRDGLVVDYPGLGGRIR